MRNRFLSGSLLCSCALLRACFCASAVLSSPSSMYAIDDELDVDTVRLDAGLHLFDGVGLAVAVERLHPAVDGVAGVRAHGLEARAVGGEPRHEVRRGSRRARGARRRRRAPRRRGAREAPVMRETQRVASPAMPPACTPPPQWPRSSAGMGAARRRVAVPDPRALVAVGSARPGARARGSTARAERPEAPWRDEPGPSVGWRVEVHVRLSVDRRGLGPGRDPDPSVSIRVDPLPLR